MIDQDVEFMDRSTLKAEVRKLRAAIRTHRDSVGHNLCWFQPELWNLLPERSDINRNVPETTEFLQKCAEYRKSLDEKIT